MKPATYFAATAFVASTLVMPPLATMADARPLAPHLAKTSCGGASWYSLRSRTASGEMMNPSAMTAAHKTLPLGTEVKVTNLNNGRAVVVRINDRGPFIKGRLIDLSKGAAQKLGFIGAGHTRVQIDPVGGAVTKSCA